MGIQTSAERRRFSRLRQSLRRLTGQLSQLIAPFYLSSPVIKGSVYELKRKCGKPGCKCARGELHSRMVVSASEKGRTKLRVIPTGSLADVQAKVRRYQDLRRARVQIVEAHKRMLQLLDQMEAMRREQTPEPESKQQDSRH